MLCDCRKFGGLLLFNCFPAKIFFMGDVGSLALGGVVACVSILGRLSLYIPILGVMFATSAVSDIIQVVHYKRTKRRVFLMAPFHHHLQKKGLSETRIGFFVFYYYRNSSFDLRFDVDLGRKNEKGYNLRLGSFRSGNV